IPEFARTGWISDLSREIPADELKRDFVPGAAESVIVDGRTFAVPWWIDAGVLYTRTDLCEPPRSFDELFRSAKAHSGYLFQGRQYEGLVCNAYEFVWGFGGETMRGDRIVIDTPEARDAMAFMASLVREGASPRAVTSAGEEESRRTFEAGRGAMMRNW